LKVQEIVREWLKMDNLKKKFGDRYVDLMEPIPVGDVVEGGGEMDWQEWEDSVAFQDSQMSDFQSSAITVRGELQSDSQGTPGAFDAFSSVTKRDG
jgi:hypothetical protein